MLDKDRLLCSRVKRILPRPPFVFRASTDKILRGQLPLLSLTPGKNRVDLRSIACIVPWGICYGFLRSLGCALSHPHGKEVRRVRVRT